MNMKGFTLIEVAVALAILGWVLGSAIFLVDQYASERIKMRDNFLSNQVAWNQLMNEYLHAQQWGSTVNGPEKEGLVTQGNQQWHWQMNVQAALGQDLYKYQISIAADNGTNARPEEQSFTPSLSLYLVNEEASP